MENKWIVMLTVVVASLIGSINMSIMLIALPAIFNGIQINPLNSFQYLLWMIMGYSLLTATLLLSFGRLSDIHGRVKMFRLGFLIFTAASVLLSLTPSTGDAGALEIIAFRMIQAVGAALFMANSAAILTDVFPSNELGKALGINTVAAMSGSFIGLVLGGILAILNWRYVFLVSVPFGVIGTFLSYYKLKEVSLKSVKTKIDIWGNATFILGITLLLIGITYGLLPYGSDPMGWSNPWVIISMILGVLALISFPFVEQRVEDPMFRFDLFKIRMFRYGNLAGLLSALGRGGMMFLLIILLQGIWLPLHGYSYESTPFWAGIYILPLTIGMSIMGPISGILSDKYGSRLIATTGMVVCTITFLLLAALPYNFNYWEFGLLVFFMGVGNGIFGSPNNASIMKSVPPNERGVASGMIYTLMNTGFTVSMGLFFTVLIVGITQRFPAEMTSSLVSIGASNLAPLLNNIPATSALFSALLGYNPIGSILASLPAPAVANIPPATLSTLTGTTWFPTTFATAFMPSLQISFYVGALLTGTAAVLSALRGDKYSHENDGVKVENLEKSKGK
ncbi:major facilitator superfamily MFS_1 [Methanobacterium lacus]|jgi:MFS family permease|uniref:Major facilitator superfamily MFS_1 n=1 Tax=Methanobacterium lacus (strain AL-21) TaxID=877455 RepID=F0TBG5_METLA|nr:MFS transporter [Methanobacterium lacus]ADZ10234.1 major facilitator superfamily MFS_1 [Methanobacterium lacus]